MNRYTFSLFAAALACLAALPAAAQTGEDALRFTRRQPLFTPGLAAGVGTGQAGVGSFSDLFQNPAGLALMDRSAFSFGLSTVSTTDDGVFQIAGSRNPMTDDLTKTRLGHLAWTYKVPTAQGSMVFAAGLARQASFDRQLSYQGENPINSLIQPRSLSHKISSSRSASLALASKS